VNNSEIHHICIGTRHNEPPWEQHRVGGKDNEDKQRGFDGLKYNICTGKIRRPNSTEQWADT
jgi:hypothetical protein